MKIGEVVRLFRICKGYTQGRLGVESDVSSPYLSLVESGDRFPTFRMLDKLATGLNIPTTYFVFMHEIEYFRQENAALYEHMLDNIFRDLNIPESLQEEISAGKMPALEEINSAKLYLVQGRLDLGAEYEPTLN